MTLTACLQVCVCVCFQLSPQISSQVTQAQLQSPTNTETHERCLSTASSNEWPTLAQRRGDGADLLICQFLNYGYFSLCRQ